MTPARSCVGPGLPEGPRPCGRAGEKDRSAYAYDDFALVRLDPADVGRCTPTVPVFGGPNALDRDGTRSGERVATCGSSSLRLGLTSLSTVAVDLGNGVSDLQRQLADARTHGVPGLTLVPGTVAFKGVDAG